MTLEPVEMLSLRPGVRTTVNRDGRRYLLTNRSFRPIGLSSPGQEQLLQALSAGPATVDDLVAAAGEPVAAKLASWRATGWLAVTVAVAGRPRYTVRPFRRPPPAPDLPRPAVLALSRFALVRRDRNELLIECPQAWCDVVVHDPTLLAPLLADPVWADDPLARRLADDLWWAGILVPPQAEQQTLANRAWYPHELWFHHRSRISERQSFGDGYGATFWLRSEFDARAADPPPRAGHTVPLHRPDEDRLRATDPPLAAVVDSRRSVREYDDLSPISTEQLGELLFRCARARPTGHCDRGSPRRPYPVAGGIYDLELYPVVHSVAGLTPGMYWYNPHTHQLETVCASNRATRTLLAGARDSAELTALPQVLLVISSRFARTMYKYQQISYALILKNVGVLYHQLYLAATAMGLAPCALGAGDVEAFAAATGSDPMYESSVGEFIVGSHPATGRATELRDRGR